MLKYLLIFLLSLTACTNGDSIKHCQTFCSPHYFVGFDHNGNCQCSPVEVECKAKGK